jgi:hypothetical protein
MRSVSVQTETLSHWPNRTWLRQHDVQGGCWDTPVEFPALRVHHRPSWSDVRLPHFLAMKTSPKTLPVSSCSIMYVYPLLHLIPAVKSASTRNFLKYTLEFSEVTAARKDLIDDA